jgi:transcriptional regulator with XRE-family HTH domain
MIKKCPALLKLGKKIRDLRKARGYSKESFADKVGLDRTYIGAIERGERNIAALNLIRIPKALKIEVGELFPPVKIPQIDSL